MGKNGYVRVGQSDKDDGDASSSASPSSSVLVSSRQESSARPPEPPTASLSPPSGHSPRRSWRIFAVAFATSMVLFLGLGLLVGDGTLFGIRRPTGPASNSGSGGNGGNAANNAEATAACQCGPSSSVPQYFQTEPELWAGPTPTGRAPFLAQTRIFDPTGAPYVPNAPLQTAIPIEGMREGERSIFEMMGYLSPYTPSPGFGVDEYPLPAGAEIIQLQMLSRHGSRYPTLRSYVQDFGSRIAAAAAGTSPYEAKGELAFLNDWKYELGAEILVSKGRQELFDSGVLHSYMYSQLYNPNTKIIARTTTQDRMLKSAENFLAGFFGLSWVQNATIEVLIEDSNQNNSLAGYLGCPNSNRDREGKKDAITWIHRYLKDATARLNALIDGYEWTIEDSYAAQTMCPYETVAYGSSRFCDLFTYDEWVNFGYSTDLNFYGNDGFGAPTGRAVGIGYQQEIMARLQNHTLGYSHSQINTTLDGNPETFPLNQSLYLDFSHDTNIISVLTALGLTQFAGRLDPAAHPGAHNFTVSHLTPFGARLDLELIRSPVPVPADRSSSPSSSGQSGNGEEETKYVHLVLNQRTVPLGLSFAECDAARVDGWCELGAFLAVQERMPSLAQFDRACFGDYAMQAVTDGAPPLPSPSAA